MPQNAAWERLSTYGGFGHGTRVLTCNYLNVGVTR
jgi:hypothetical protein